MAQLRGATESSRSALSQFSFFGFHDWKAKVGRTGRFRDSNGVDWGVSGGRMVADGMEVSAVREGIWTPVVDAALHQLRFGQGRSGGGGAKKVILQRE